MRRKKSNLSYINIFIDVHSNNLKRFKLLHLSNVDIPNEAER